MPLTRVVIPPNIAYIAHEGEAYFSGRGRERRAGWFGTSGAMTPDTEAGRGTDDEGETTEAVATVRKAL